MVSLPGCGWWLRGKLNPSAYRGKRTTDCQGCSWERAMVHVATLQVTNLRGLTCWHSAAGGGIRHQRSSSHPAEIKPKELEIHWKAHGGDHHRHTQPPRSSRPSAAMPCCASELLPGALWSSRNGTRTWRDDEREPTSELWPPTHPGQPPARHRPPGPVPARRSRPGTGPGR